MRHPDEEQGARLLPYRLGRERPGRRPASCPGWSGRLRFLAAESSPILHVLPAQLRHATWRQAVFVGHVQRSLALQEVIDDPTVALAAAADPGAKINPETLT